MASSKSPTGVRLKPFYMSNFSGLDSSVDSTAQDSGENQPLDILSNAYCDWRGQIIRNPAIKNIISAGYVTHVRFYSSSETENNIVFAEQNDADVSLKSDVPEHTVESVYPSGSVVTSTVFADKVHLTSQAGFMYNYDGSGFQQNTSKTVEVLSPKYCCSVQRRLVVAGLIGKRNAVHLSRVDSDNIFPDDESPIDENVLRAVEIDITNLIGTADQIQGIGSFEQNRLAIFTRNKTLIYQIDPDLNNIAIDERANINIGTISHNSIAQAGRDLIFCSARGVHTIQRSTENGILVYANILSQKVDLIYRGLLKKVSNKEKISATWDSETGQYHVFFPSTSASGSRLTLTLNAGNDDPNNWSLSTYINASCGDAIGDRLIMGANGGVFEVADIEDTDKELSDVPMVIKTPVSWHGSMVDEKGSHSMFIHASGKADLLVEIFNEHNAKLEAFELSIDDPEDGVFTDNPIIRQYDRKFEARYRGLRTQITSTGKGLLRIVAIGFNVRN